MARLMVGQEGGAGGRLQKQSTKKRKTTMLAQGVQAARTLSTSSKRQCDLIGLEPRSGRAACRRVAANSSGDLQLWLLLSGEDHQQGASPPAEANLDFNLSLRHKV